MTHDEWMQAVAKIGPVLEHVLSVGLESEEGPSLEQIADAVEKVTPEIWKLDAAAGRQPTVFVPGEPALGFAFALRALVDGANRWGALSDLPTMVIAAHFLAGMLAES